MQIKKIREFHIKNYENQESLEFQSRLLKVMKIKKFHVRITIMTILEFLMSYENQKTYWNSHRQL